MITRLTFNDAPMIAFGGASFGDVGSYEKIHGRAFGELDPANPLNAVITDITLAPRNTRGMVEYAVDFSESRAHARKMHHSALVSQIFGTGWRMSQSDANCSRSGIRCYTGKKQGS